MLLNVVCTLAAVALSAALTLAAFAARVPARHRRKSRLPLNEVASSWPPNIRLLGQGSGPRKNTLTMPAGRSVQVAFSPPIVRRSLIRLRMESRPGISREAD